MLRKTSGEPPVLCSPVCVGTAMTCAGYVARMGAKRNVCRTLVAKPEGKGSLERPGGGRERWDEAAWLGIGDRDQWKALVNSVLNPTCT
jgi:hypothetical protein